MNAVYYPRYGLHLYEYLLIIEPDNLVQKQLQAFKQYFSKVHPYRNAILPKGHLTLMRFIQYDSYEKHIIGAFQRIADQATPFDVELNGFGSFGHTLYIDVKSTIPILQLIANHSQILRPLVNGSNGHPVRLTGKPHITVARKLTPSQHAVIWPIWNRTQYRNKFRARNMILLKRRVGTHRYATVRKYDFLGLSPAVMQGKLFA